MRHAKAERPVGIADRDRPLAVRGRHDAAAIGRALARLDPAPSVVATSPALRARQTAETTTSAAGWGIRPTVREGLYGGGIDEVLAVVLSTDADVMVLVGHEPAWSAAVAALTGASVRMVTAAVAAVEIPAGPALLGRGSILWMLTPRLVEGRRPA